MKKFFIISVVTLISALSVFGQDDNTGDRAMRFAHKRWSFGQIDEAAGSVRHTFTFTNVSSKAVVVENVEVTCGCTTIDFSTKPVMPGGKGEITVMFDPENRPGPFDKAIIIRANSGTLRTTLAVEGNVVERERTIEELYPFSVVGGLRINERAAYMRYMPQGEATSVTIGIANGSAKEIKLGTVVDKRTPWLKIYLPASLPPGGKTQITITYDLSAQKSAYGTFTDEIYLTANGVKSKTPITALGYGVDKFSQGGDINASPRARFDFQYHDFGTMKTSDAAKSQQFTITNTGSQPLVLRHVETGQGVSVTLREGLTIPPSKSAKFTVTISPSKMERGDVTESIIMIFNDPLRPMREFRVAAEIK